MIGRYKLNQESLLASEELSIERKEAEGGTPQLYEAFTKASEDEAVAQRLKKQEEEETDSESDAPEDNSESDGDGGDDDVAEDGDSDPSSDAEESEEESSEDDKDDGENDKGDNENEEDGEKEATKDSIDDTEETTESFGDWVKDKTQFSDSSIIRNGGAMIAGLSHLGITYGPAILSYAFKGVLWGFSRLGMVLYNGTVSLNAYIEKSRNSLDKLSKRLEEAELAITNTLNEGDDVPKFTYKNKSAIGYLKIGDGTDFIANIRRFSDSLSKSTSGISSEFEAGVSLVQRMAKMDSKAKTSGLKQFMEVNAPRQGFTRGTVSGFEAKSDLITQYRTEYWPGDVALVFDCPVIDSNDIKEITEAYEKASMFLAVNRSGVKPVEDVPSLSGTELILLAKSTKILISACEAASKTHEKMSKMSPTIGQAAKRMFFDLADDKVKTKMEDTMLEPVFLRSALATKVYTAGSTSALTHASRVIAASVKLLEDHSKKLISGG